MNVPISPAITHAFASPVLAAKPPRERPKAISSRGNPELLVDFAVALQLPTVLVGRGPLQCRWYVRGARLAVADRRRRHSR